MSYSCLGNCCAPVTGALTSNAKYITPLSQVYYQPWTTMAKYPGHTGFHYPNMQVFGHGPESVKAWNTEGPLGVDQAIQHPMLQEMGTRDVSSEQPKHPPQRLASDLSLQ